jgi:acyl-CoA thioester hydrolase
LKKYSIEYTVADSDLDQLNHVNNVRYLEWVQEISKSHWELISNNAFIYHYFWVVRSHFIEYFKGAVLGDVLSITTYVSELKGPISTRIVEFQLEESNTPIARCETQWVLIDFKTAKPCRIPDAIKDLFN